MLRSMVGDHLHRRRPRLRRRPAMQPFLQDPPAGDQRSAQQKKSPSRSKPPAEPANTSRNEQASPQHHAAPGHRRLRAVVLRHPALPLGHLRRPDAVQGEALRDQGPLRRGDASWPNSPTSASPASTSAKSRASPWRRTASRRWRPSTSTTSTRRCRSRRGRSCAPRPCSARPTSNSPPATATGPKLADGGTLPEANLAESVQLDEIFRTFDPETRAAFQSWMQEAAVAINGQGQSLSYAIGRARTDLHRIRQALPHPRHPAPRRRPALPQRRHHLPRPARPRRRAGEPDPELQRRLPDHRPRATSDIEALFRAFPTFHDESQPDPRTASRPSRSTPTR